MLDYLKSLMTPAKPPVAFTDQDLADYRDKGVVVCKGLIPEKTVAQWRAEWLKLKVDLERQNAPGLRRTDRFILGDELPGSLGKIYEHPALVEAAKKIIGPDIALYMNRLLVKDEHWDGHVTPHQDCVYFHGSTDKLSAFVPLTEFSPRTGGVRFVEGSHKYGNLGRRGTIRYEDWEAMPILAPQAFPGDVIFASFEIWHHSESSELVTDRPLIQTTYQSAADGSYQGQPDRPTLVCGEWRTTHFTKFEHGIIF